MSHASKSFGARPVFTNLSFRALTGEVTALVGPSGSGKSTVLALVAGVATPDEGEVRLIGASCASTPPHPSFVCWVPQGVNCLARRTVLDNVSMSALAGGRTLEEARRRAGRAMADCGIAELANRHAGTLSGGELQRVAFARAIASDRPIVLADEPSANLDAVSAERLGASLQSMPGDCTVVVATHDPILVDAADRVVDLRSLR